MSKQLKIDLDDDGVEQIHIYDTRSTSGGGESSSVAPIIFSELTDTKIQSMVDEFVPADGPCQIQIRRLGEYLAKISLQGGYSVPLRFTVLRRN